MSNILNGTIQTNGLGYVKANVDGIEFNKIKTKSKSTVTPNPVMPANNGNLWKANNEDLSSWVGINAVDIDWNGAEVEENVIINTTGELLNWIKNKCNSSSSDSEKINEIQNTIELYHEVFNSLLDNLLSKKYANENFQEKGNYVTTDQYNMLLNKVNYLENIVDNIDNVNYTYYLGIASEELIQNQSYINSLNYNSFGKPTSINFAEGYNILIVPESWGTPIVKDPNGFPYSEFGLEELGITNPEGKIVLVYSSGPIDVTLEWN